MEVLSVIGLVVATQLVKKYVKPRFGATGVHAFVFLLAFGIISVKGLMTTYPPFGEMVLVAGSYLVTSLAVYEVILKQLNSKLNLY